MRTFNNVAKLVKSKRVAHPKSYSQMELAQLLGLKTHKLIASIEAAECNVPLKTMPKLSKILNIHPDEFVKAALMDHEESLERYFKKKFKTLMM